MAVNEQTGFDESTATGLTGVFPYTFKILRLEDMRVEIDGAVIDGLGDYTYTVSGIGEDAGGNVTITPNPTAGAIVLRALDAKLDRQTNYQYAGDLKSQTVNADFDRLWLAMQVIKRRALMLPITEIGDNVLAADPDGRAGKALIFDAEGRPIASPDNWNDTAANAEAAIAAKLAAEAAADAAEASADRVDLGALDQAVVDAEAARDAAQLAETNAELAASQAASAQLAAEAARDAAQLSAGVYASTAAGIAATSSGDYFSVPQASPSSTFLDLYLNNAGVAQYVNSYPSAAAAIQASVSRGLVWQQPNLFSPDDLDFLTTADRYIDAGIQQASIAAGSTGNTPAWQITTPANTVSGAIEWRFPVSSLGGATVWSAALTVLAADAGGGSGSRDILVRVKQQDSGGVTIGAATQTKTISTGAAITEKQDVRFEGVAVNGSAAFIVLQVTVQNQVNASPRSIYVRDLLVAAGANGDFRQPTRLSNDSDAIAGTSVRRLMTPAADKAALDARVNPLAALIATETARTDEIIEALVGHRYEPPAGLSWPSKYPLYIYRGYDGSVKALINPRAFVDPAIWTATPYYVDAARSDNTGDGRSWATAKRDINAAITAANADAEPAALIYVKAATGNAYFQTRSINGSAGTVEPTKPCAFVADGGRVRHWAGTTEASWVDDGSGNNTYTGGPSSAVRVFDRLNMTDGLYTELTNVADQAAVRATPGSWSDIGANLAVHRTDGLAPTVDNTLVLRNISVAALDSCTTDLYFEGFDFEGGPFGALWCDPVADRNVVAVDCTFRYAGTSTNMLDGLRVRRTRGLVLAVRCSADSNWKDGFNYHTDSSGGIMYVLQIDCTSQDNGRAGSSSNNGFTTHDDVIAIDVSGEHGPTNNGAVFHVIENTKTWAVGSVVESDAGGDTERAGFKASNNAILWLEDTTAETADAGDYALFAQGTAGTIHKRNHTSVTGIEYADPLGGVIDTF